MDLNIVIFSIVVLTILYFFTIRKDIDQTREIRETFNNKTIAPDSENYPISPTRSDESRSNHFRQLQQVTGYLSGREHGNNPERLIDRGIYEPEHNDPGVPDYSNTPDLPSDRPNFPEPENARDVLPPADFQSDSTNVSQFFKNNPELFNREFTGYVPNPQEWEKMGQDIYNSRLNEAMMSTAPAEAYLDPQTEAITVPGQLT